MAKAKTGRKKAPKSIEGLVEQLREAIVAGVLMPNERLIEVDLSESLGTNRTNVRTVLALLEQEGLVTREPNRGARVRVISDREAIEIAEARQVLEVLVARQAAERIKPAQMETLRGILASMKQAHAGTDLKAFSVQNGRLHGTIREIADNETATKLLAGLRFHFVRIQYQALFKPGRLDRSMQEHIEIVEALCARNAEAAGAAMHRHLENIKENIQWYRDTSMPDVGYLLRPNKPAASQAR